MQIKKFEAFQMSDALRAVKQELGPDAVILSAKEVRRDEGVFGVFGRPMVEVTAAVDRPAVTVSVEESPAEFAAFLKEAPGPARPEPESGDVQKELRAIRGSIGAIQASLTVGYKQQMAGIQDTWSEMKGLLRGLVEQRESSERAGLHSTLVALFDRLLENGVDRGTVVDLLRLMKRKLSPDELWKTDFVRQYLQDQIKAMVQVSGPLECAGDRPKVVALVGPTGVGKTTTIAKLAAHHYRQTGRVTLATLDTYRVGAVEQLKIYAKIIGVPVDVATSGGELREVVARRKQGDLVLVDTAGRSHLSAGQVAELKDLGKVGIPVETHLVLSSNTKESDLDDIVDRFSVIPIDRLLFTKTDETQTYGPLFATMKKKGKPLSYLTTGQRVPEDIEVATPTRVAELVLN
jgi:flagellar biosynthesis protein FlhF